MNADNKRGKLAKAPKATKGKKAPPTTDLSQPSPLLQPSQPLTQPRSSVPMTKYEHAKVIGIRAEQIARGAQQFVTDDPGSVFDPIDIASRELQAGVLPFIVVRKLPDGTEEKWRLNDFIVPI